MPAEKKSLNFHTPKNLYPYRLRNLNKTYVVNLF